MLLDATINFFAGKDRIHTCTGCQVRFLANGKVEVEGIHPGSTRVVVTTATEVKSFDIADVVRA